MIWSQLFDFLSGTPKIKAIIFCVLINWSESRHNLFVVNREMEDKVCIVLAGKPWYAIFADLLNRSQIVFFD